MKWVNMISISSTGICTPVWYSNETHLERYLQQSLATSCADESETVIKWKTFLQAVSIELNSSNLWSNKNLSTYLLIKDKISFLFI